MAKQLLASGAAIALLYCAKTCYAQRQGRGWQVVLEVYESRVRTGGPVYEEGHTLVLGWCENQRDEETMWKLLSQVGPSLVQAAMPHRTVQLQLESSQSQGKSYDAGPIPNKMAARALSTDCAAWEHAHPGSLQPAAECT